MTTEITKDLEAIKDSSALKDDLWIQLENLCKTINVVCRGIQDDLYLFDKNYKRNHLLDHIEEYTFQIGTLAEIIEEKIPHNDLVDIANIIHGLVAANEKEEKIC
ncbi:hypothetical protein [Bacteroides sp. 51]|uniref:hypothetical protein n=1 Tax=Bacteroides sp. 51 TaxID=2302938 RepID=UPI0013D5DCFC|nr:hypothetical protein [Bacteroides sp. 51]NDV82221.1 hypothetical protein [Bacteroides sp. 51]